ncbi:MULTISPECIES: hydrogenase nickel incorporation protein HypB [Acidobacterium]|uniref:Hydrogenase accessory protein HypB n=1 Tax=Acidobacterium capsulatum (strain ATCC 51196 / DSM 11244 / BCRC 80197 / JCM 7670 / NBRC 15755 / NCIMB 13165 / 161) TaxID=240015 RepID=C1F4L4_ACIC5|nr:MULTISPECIES: hydrogenase nickel incorporation protein HypB [Acidobacterium]ACO32513.1 hydrogenase accessory protein HypB [Acidobacterium capsulatum ATCC 51196]HCT61830.1 hydrogenase accessory protein HypB [Acidobacterium sp.]
MNVVPQQKLVLSENQRIANELRSRFEAQRTYCLNIVSSPGSGKTTLLEKTLERFDRDARIAVLTGDLQTENDAKRLARYGFPVQQITTGGVCHLDAGMILRALDAWQHDELDLLLIENVGNLVCPASYDLGEDARIVLLSVTEGEDKPLKYPSIFAKSHLMILTKSDLLPYVSFDVESAQRNAKIVHPDIEMLTVSSTTADGLDGWIGWLATRREEFRRRQIPAEA